MLRDIITMPKYMKRRCFYQQNNILGVKKFKSIPNGEFNPLSPHDALKHHFTSLKTILIFLKPRVLERKFPSNWFTNTW